MTDIRALRQSLQTKLEHRRELMADTRRLRAALDQSERNREFERRVLNNPLVDRQLEHMADKLVAHIMNEALRLSDVVAQERFGENGIVEVGLDIPSLHIRHAFYEQDLRAADMTRMHPCHDEPIPIKRVNLRAFDKDGS